MKFLKLIFIKRSFLFSLEMFDAPRRSLRIKAKNLEKIFKAEREHLVAELAECKASLVGELPEIMSQKLQNSNANIDNLNYKQSMLRSSFALCPNEHYLKMEALIESVCDSRDPHYARYCHLHSDYCLIWFRAYSKWGCLDSLRETGGYFDKNIPNCGYRHNDLDN